MDLLDIRYTGYEEQHTSKLEMCTSLRSNTVTMDLLDTRYTGYEEKHIESSRARTECSRKADTPRSPTTHMEGIIAGRPHTVQNK
ncbi:hypothetical protein RRG08_008437 [Elysia crispata]|uniref:Uncharacterized protein n=1 Tax=Elysia crispata TaxID=231223 RepID=A0AAE1E727_9GAST|nr:hypothetical protein RRG08_008437 [Elysia crispata]